MTREEMLERVCVQEVGCGEEEGGRRPGGAWVGVDVGIDFEGSKDYEKEKDDGVEGEVEARLKPLCTQPSIRLPSWPRLQMHQGVHERSL